MCRKDATLRCIMRVYVIHTEHEIAIGELLQSADCMLNNFADIHMTNEQMMIFLAGLQYKLKDVAQFKYNPDDDVA